MRTQENKSNAQRNHAITDTKKFIISFTSPVLLSAELQNLFLTFGVVRNDLTS